MCSSTRRNGQPARKSRVSGAQVVYAFADQLDVPDVDCQWLKGICWIWGKPRSPVRNRQEGYDDRVIVRGTTRLLEFIGERPPRAGGPAPCGDDWYANLLVMDRRRCLLLMHAETLFPVFAPDVRKAQLRPLGPFVGALVGNALAAEELPPDTLGVLDVARCVVARTANRQVLGYMNDVAYMCHAADGVDPGTVADLNQRLRRGLHNQGGYSDPLTRIAERAAR